MEKTRSIAQFLTTLHFCPSHFLFIISIGMWRLDVLLGWYSVHVSLRYATFLIPLPASTATSFYFHVINHTSVHLPVLCGDLLNDVTSLFCISHFKEEKRLNLNGIFFQGSHSMFYSRLLLMSAVFNFLLISKGSCDFNMLKLNRNKKERTHNKQNVPQCETDYIPTNWNVLKQHIFVLFNLNNKKIWFPCHHGMVPY